MAQTGGFSTVNDNKTSRVSILPLTVLPSYGFTDNVTTSSLNNTRWPSSNDLLNLTTSTAARIEEQTTDQATLQWMMILQWIFAVVGILGIISNLFVLVVVLRAKKFRQKPRNWFIFHQSVADLISAVSMVLISRRNTDLLTLSDSLLDRMRCALWESHFSLQSSSLASSYILAAFSIEVYMAIVHPVRHKNVFSHRLVALMVTAAWVIGISYPLGIYTGAVRVIKNICYPAYAWRYVALPMGIFNFFIRMIIPMSLCVGFYCLIFAFLARRVKVATETVANNAVVKTVGLPTNQRNWKQFSHASQNVAITVLYTIIGYLVTMMGYQIIVLLEVFGYPQGTGTPPYMALLLITYFTNLVTPVVYAVKYKEFRHATALLLSCDTKYQETTSGSG